MNPPPRSPASPWSPRPPRPLAVTILAAGLGRRLGGVAKAALLWRGQPLLAHQMHTLHAAGLTTARPVQVVIGPYAEVLLPLVQACGAQAVPHRLAQPSLVDSQRLAVQAHRHSSPGCDLLLLLADLPHLQAADMLQLTQAWAQRPRHVQALRPLVSVLVDAHEGGAHEGDAHAGEEPAGGQAGRPGAPGHPVLLSRLALRQIQHSPPHQGVRDWLAQHRPQLAWLPSTNPAYLRDVDTPHDLATLQAQGWGHQAVKRPSNPPGPSAPG